jgi:hypothetical protein
LRSRNKKRDEKIFFEDSYGGVKVVVDEEDRPIVVRTAKEDELDKQLSDQTEASERISILTS